MKTLIIILILNSVIFSQTDFLDIQFYSGSDRVFHSKHLKSEIDSLNEFNSNPFVLLIVTDSTNNNEYQKQLAYLKTINAEKLQLLYVYSNVEQIDKSGYYTNKLTASNLLGKDLGFRVLILNGYGKIIYDYYKALTDERIKKLLRQ